MSEPNKTGGRPLDPTTTQLHQLKSTTTPKQTTSYLDRPITSSTSNQHKAPKKTSPRRRPGTARQAATGPHIGSPRPEQSASSPMNMASHISSVHYTRTGRISKAKKGLKVHNCENCGRSYTRAEHLRRHQKNHAPDALICEVAGCGKPFHRMDLLVRHMERHNEPGHDSPQQSPADSPEPMNASNSPLETSSIMATAALPEAPFYQPVSSPHESALPSRYNYVPFRTPRTPQTFPSNFSQFPRSSPQSMSSPNQSKRPNHQIGRQVMGAAVPVDNVPGLWQDSYSPTPECSSGYMSPNIPSEYPIYGSMSYNRARTPSNASCLDQPGWSFPSRSPASTTSTMGFSWPSAEKAHTAPGLAYMHTSCPMTTMSMATSFDTMPGFDHFGPKSMAQRDEDEGGVLFGDQQYGMASIENTYPFEQCLDYYWRLFHPTFPIIHRSTPVSSSPMLYAAMAAIGGQYSHDTRVKKQSRDLHDRCNKLLERREHEAMTEPDRLCDFQAIFLIEVLSQYRARRAAKFLSARFDKVYHKLGEIVSSLDQLENFTADRWYQWIELASWQRLLLSCFILESQQPLLLARESQSSLIQDTAFEAPFPGHTLLWDAADFAAWKMAARQHSYAPIYVSLVTPESVSASLDIFQSAVIIATDYNCHDPSSPYISCPTTSDVEHLLSPASVTTRSLSTAKLVQVTPLRALLAVSGESWIFSEKVTMSQLLTKFKITLRTWLSHLWSTPTLEVLWAITVASTTRAKGSQPRIHPHHRPRSQSQSPPVFSSMTTALQTMSSTQLPSQPLPSSAPASFQQSTVSSTQSQPQSPIMGATPENPLLSHTQITINTISFLADAQYAFSNAATVTPTAADHARHQTGCASLLLWVKLRLRGAPLEGPTDIANTSASGPDEGLGELLNGVTGTLERILNRGWSGWGI
ncbi:c2h2 finger domain-containing protein [Stemphylium lycopersici]|uniref:C2h2 finger domain-containing protein n=1 Tax=Stemphylium lycopersici TaxID=183478 RepID=A0A364MVP3_STELY|nr:c2h2 finger domain-containing protein [Stemphylium lycopersici]RAR04916.1 c2h2 finger domain-containing protein [Stemphylium lycopersici]